MEFRTVVPVEKMPYPISHRDRLLLFGSCFAENIGQKLEDNKFQTDINPFGILYNPLSIAGALNRVMESRFFESGDIFKQGNLWHSFMHHSRFSHTDAGICLEQINKRFSGACAGLKSAQWLIITWGTSFVYSNKENGKVVSNCHKLPASGFDRRRVEITEMEETWIPLLERLFTYNPGMRILLTVSPIRHFRDGAHQNQLSKSGLMLLAANLCRLFPEKCFYFPSYEIMMDELRDYRFYDPDMTHPSLQAVDYIWERFAESFFTRETITLNNEWDRVRKALNHRPLTPDSESYRNFVMQNLFKLKKIREKYPYFDITKEIGTLELLMKSL